ncbi:sigma-54-dependent transcriptional regulator [Flavobacterium rhizosphaerae]|uniref:Sigma-54 dependent transcriptional regulator n=1 Tax=Flavobacterium rhizosphaerae TaxID=3163298 RepID=A0ABW8Z1L0_9FLAO
MSSKILVIDDDTAFCMMLKTFLQKNAYEVTNAFTAEQAQQEISKQKFDVVLTDIRLPDSDGLKILKLVKEASQNTQVILMTGYVDIKTAVNAIKLGAYDYVGKPINPEEILYTIGQAITKKAERQTAPVSKPKQASVPFVEGVSKESALLHEHIKLVAPTNMSVLIMGDSGTGKEYIAQSIHTNSKRAGKPFIAVDCGAIPKELASSEFFGHLKGSFTGAVTDKTGHFEAANGGTLFLDEVGNLSYEVQVQLLRALQERKIKPVGSNQETQVDIRVVAATNEDLAEAVKKGDFREDLYHRLNEFTIKAPRLSERKKDIMIFALHFLQQANEDLEKEVQGFDEEVEDFFCRYDWPGNLREMRNIIKRSVLLEKGSVIHMGVLPQEMQQAVKEGSLLNTYTKADEERAIMQALEKANYNKSKAARLLDIDRKTLYNKLKLYNINL